MKVLYLDESGDHNLNRIDPVFPVFVLGGVIVERAYAREVIEPAFADFKLRHFEEEDVILHTVEMSKGRGIYGFLADPVKRQRFYSDLNATIDSLEFKVVACAINKTRHLAQYGANAADPYTYSLEILVERFCMELGDRLDSGFICAERRNPGLDKELLRTWESLVSDGRGTGYAKSKDINDRVIGFDLKDKKPNIAGMQLADLVVTPIGRYVANRPSKRDEIQWSIVEKKLRRVRGRYQGKGLIVRP